MLRNALRRHGITAASVVVFMTVALIAPGAAFAQRTITVVIPEELDCNARTKMFSGFKITVKKVDDATIDIVTPQPDPILPVRMTTLTIGYPNEQIRVLNNSVGTGPYMIDHYTANSEVVLKRNPNYWGTKPQLDGARYVWRKESAVAAAMVKVGEAHLATNISHQDAIDPKTDFAYPNSETNYLRIESQVPPL